MTPTRLPTFALLTALMLTSCDTKKPPKTKLVYFGFDNHAEKPEDALYLATMWSGNSVCSHWRATVKREVADYQVLFGITDVKIIDHRGQILYSGSQDVLHTPHGNPDGSGINICKLTGE